jgi:hypothetical protein
MPNSAFAPSVEHSFAPMAVRWKPRVQMHDLLALLKVRTFHAVIITLLLVTQYWLQFASSLWQQPRLLVDVFFGMFAWNVWCFIGGFAIIAVGQVRLAPGRARTLTLIGLLLVWVLLWQSWHLVAGSHFIVVQLGLVPQAGVIASGLWSNTVYFTLAVWYYESIDRATRSTASLRESELARRSAERWLLELRLGALQARLDPQVLFDTLDEAGRLYKSRPAAAEQLLDALIDYLRHALPKLRQAESTLQREIELALAYARVLRTPEGKALELEAVVEPTVGDARFPPMVVQPLCNELARSALASGEPARLRISATRDRDDARLRLTAEPVRAIASSERLAEVRRTLHAMFAPLVRIEASCTAANLASVLVEVPYVAVPRIDR